ncbi:MAG: DUF4912 domain-containing protein [Candidatus Omnitrophica bacterium]|nr:DUF4912 domain-containing protein [Candidatus Omnitrophota bacterium]
MSNTSYQEKSSKKTAPALQSADKYHIPSYYGDNKLVLLVRDPWTIFSYWEVRKDVEDGIRKKINDRGLIAEKSLLRVYDITDCASVLEAKNKFDFELRGWIESWYVHTNAPGRTWVAEIGIMCTNGEFFPIARSNQVTAPAYGMSDTSDDRWMCPEDLYYKMFAIAGGYGIGKSSLSIKEIIQRHLKEWMSSGGLLSWFFGSASLFSKRR